MFGLFWVFTLYTDTFGTRTLATINKIEFACEYARESKSPLWYERGVDSQRRILRKFPKISFECGDRAVAWALQKRGYDQTEIRLLADVSFKDISGNERIGTINYSHRNFSRVMLNFTKNEKVKVVYLGSNVDDAIVSLARDFTLGTFFLFWGLFDVFIEIRRWRRPEVNKVEPVETVFSAARRLASGDRQPNSNSDILSDARLPRSAIPARWADRTKPSDRATRHRNFSLLLTVMQIEFLLVSLFICISILQGYLHTNYWQRANGTIVSTRDLCEFSIKPLFSRSERYKKIYCDDETAADALLTAGWRQGTISQELSINFDDKGKPRQTILEDWKGRSSVTGGIVQIRYWEEKPERTELASRADSDYANSLQIIKFPLGLVLALQILKFWLRRAQSRNSQSPY